MGLRKVGARHVDRHLRLGVERDHVAVFGAPAFEAEPLVTRAHAIDVQRTAGSDLITAASTRLTRPFGCRHVPRVDVWQQIRQREAATTLSSMPALTAASSTPSRGTFRPKGRSPIRRARGWSASPRLISRSRHSPGATSTVSETRRGSSGSCEAPTRTPGSDDASCPERSSKRGTCTATASSHGRGKITPPGGNRHGAPRPSTGQSIRSLPNGASSSASLTLPRTRTLARASGHGSSRYVRSTLA